MNSIGLIELNSIAQGYKVSDEMIKAANVELLECMPICPGKFLILVGGEVADVNSSVQTGANLSEEYLIDKLILSRVHHTIFSAINATTAPVLKAIGIIETFTISSGIFASDTIAKTASVELVEIRIARGQGGKTFCIFTGDIGSVEVALEAGKESIKEMGGYVNGITIASPHEDLSKYIF